MNLGSQQKTFLEYNLHNCILISAGIIAVPNKRRLQEIFRKLTLKKYNGFIGEKYFLFYELFSN